MAEFKIAEAETGRAEGLYANNPKDTGKETFAGISRLWWPKSKIWPIIDKIKKAVVKPGMNIHNRNVWKLINKESKKYPELVGLISSFYKINFWNINQLDRINDQQIANTVYDFSVNAGEDEAAETLQESVNILMTGYPNLSVDGDVGNKTIAAVNLMNPKAIYEVYNQKRLEHYERLAKRPGQAQFLPSWKSRLKPYKSC